MPAINPYFDQMILSASPVELIRLLYQRAISKVREAREHLREGRIEERAAAISLSYRVLTELMNSLDAASAPELSRRLLGLYCYVQERLVAGNLEQRDEPLAEALGVLVTLADAWSGVRDSNKSDVAAANAWAAPMSGDESAHVALTA